MNWIELNRYIFEIEWNCNYDGIEGNATEIRRIPGAVYIAGSVDPREHDSHAGSPVSRHADRGEENGGRFESIPRRGDTAAP